VILRWFFHNSFIAEFPSLRGFPVTCVRGSFNRSRFSLGLCSVNLIRPLFCHLSTPSCSVMSRPQTCGPGTSGVLWQTSSDRYFLCRLESSFALQGLSDKLRMLSESARPYMPLLVPFLHLAFPFRTFCVLMAKKRGPFFLFFFSLASSRTLSRDLAQPEKLLISFR